MTKEKPKKKDQISKSGKILLMLRAKGESESKKSRK